MLRQLRSLVHGQICRSGFGAAQLSPPNSAACAAATPAPSSQQ